MAQPPTSCFNRRGFLVATAATPLAGFVGAAAAQPAAGPAPAPPSAEESARLWLNNAEADALTALVDRLIPASESGPGAVEVGVVTYIDCQLASNLGAASTWYMRGSFAEGAPSQGWQLGGLSSSVFFEFLLGNTIEAYFADPLYGGNRGGETWKRIGYPGANPVLTQFVGDKSAPEIDPLSIG